MVLSLDEYIKRNEKHEIVICGNDAIKKEIKKQLDENDVDGYVFFDRTELLKKERFVSYSYADTNEDLILYHVLKGEEIFWIDIGSNDPMYGSVTQAFYERGGRGINIDIEEELIDISKKIRNRDINLNIGIGKENGQMDFYVQGDFGGLNTSIEENIRDGIKPQKKTIEIMKLEDVCKEYLPENQIISFLKIDVEGMERDVLEGADFVHYRPKIVVVESTIPCTNIPNYTQWEKILLSNGYHFVYTHEINRYYVADECSNLDQKFIPFPNLAAQYCVFLANLTYVVR